MKTVSNSFGNSFYLLETVSIFWKPFPFFWNGFSLNWILYLNNEYIFVYPKWINVWSDYVVRPMRFGPNPACLFFFFLFSCRVCYKWQTAQFYQHPFCCDAYAHRRDINALNPDAGIFKLNLSVTEELFFIYTKLRIYL